MTTTPAPPTPSSVTPLSALSEPVAQHLLTLCDEYRALADIRLAAEKRQKELMTDIRETADGLGVTKVEAPGWGLARVSKRWEKIRPELLLEAGVGAEVIEGATERGETVYWTVTGRKPETEDREP